jgi:hypothetical protein
VTSPPRALVVVAALALTGCSAGARSPEGAVRKLADASAAGDHAVVWSLLGPETKRRLEAQARHAAPIAGRRAIAPEDLIAVGWEPPRFRLTSIKLRERRGDEAQVEVRGPAGQVDVVRCVRVGDRWSIELAP